MKNTDTKNNPRRIKMFNILKKLFHYKKEMLVAEPSQRQPVRNKNEIQKGKEKRKRIQKWRTSK